MIRWWNIPSLWTFETPSNCCLFTYYSSYCLFEAPKQITPPSGSAPIKSPTRSPTPTGGCPFTPYSSPQTSSCCKNLYVFKDPTYGTFINSSILFSNNSMFHLFGCCSPFAACCSTPLGDLWVASMTCCVINIYMYLRRIYRSVFRYASVGLLVVVLLHALEIQSKRWLPVARLDPFSLLFNCSQDDDGIAIQASGPLSSACIVATSESLTAICVSGVQHVCDYVGK